MKLLHFSTPAPVNGTGDALIEVVQQLGNGAIVELLDGGRSFSDGRARGEGSKGYIVKRDAHNEFGSGQPTRWKRRRVDRKGPQIRANKLAGRCLYFATLPSTLRNRNSIDVVISAHILMNSTHNSASPYSFT